MSVCIPARQENGPKATEGVNVSLGIYVMRGRRGEQMVPCVRERRFDFVSTQRMEIKSLAGRRQFNESEFDVWENPLSAFV